MSYVQVVNENLMPVSEVLIANQNTVGQKYMKVLYPVENSANYGYGLAGSSKDLTFVVGSAHEAWLPQESYLQFSLQMGTTAGLLPGSVDAVFQKVRVLSPQGTVLLEDAAANVISIITQLTTISNENKALQWEEGLDQLNVTQADAANTITTSAVQYLMKLKQPFFRTLSCIPLPITGQVRIAFSMAVDAQAITYCTGDTYKLTSPQLVCAMVGYEQHFLDKLRQIALKGGLLLSFVQNYYSNAPSSNAGDNALQVNFGTKNALSLIAVNRIIANDASASRVENLGRYQAPITLQEIYAQIGSDKYPSCGLDSYVRAWAELKKVINVWGDVDAGNQIIRIQYEYSSATNAILLPATCSKFIVGIDFRTADGTGIDTLQGPVVFHQKFAEANTNFVAEVFIQYQSVL